MLCPVPWSRLTLALNGPSSVARIASLSSMSASTWSDWIEPIVAAW
jgi:hypothetical protein